MALLQRTCALHGGNLRATQAHVRPAIARVARQRLTARAVPQQPASLDSTIEAAAVPSSTGEASSSGRDSPLQQLESWLRAPRTRVLSFVTAAAGAGLFGSGFDLEGPGSVLEALGVLAAIVAVHEAGHFLAARLQGIHVTQFAIGFGPPLLTYKGKEVEYSLRAIPLGGYVAFPDDDPSNTYAPDDPDLLRNRSLPSRALVISAGVLANIMFAWLVLFAQVNTVGKAETAYQPGVLVPEVIAGGAAEEAGFKPGDTILRVGNYTVAANAEQVPSVVSRIKASPDQSVPFLVKRGDQQLELSAVPRLNREGKGAIGVSLTSNTTIGHVKPSGLPEAVQLANGEFQRLASTVTNGLSQIFTNFTGVAGQLSGPVAIVAQGSEVVRRDAAGLYQFCAIVNLNLALVNTLPLPALDGGYLFLLLLEGLRGKKLPEELEQGVMTSGLLLLMVLGVGLVIKDTISLL